MTTSTGTHPADELLSSLSVHDIDAMRTARTRERAHRVLARQRRAHRLKSSAGFVYSRYLEPVLVLGLVSVVLVWAFERAAFVLL